jgi:ketosteroid isomerase-like protein
MRRLLIGGALGVALLSPAACGNSGTSSEAQQLLQRKADYWEINQIEKTFHKATTLRDIDLMMSLYSPNATFTLGSMPTAAGREEIRELWLEESIAFEPTTHLISDHPPYKVRITVSGDRGTLHFECHYVDVRTGEVVQSTAADADVSRIDARWLITNLVGGSAELTP